MPEIEFLSLFDVDAESDAALLRRLSRFLLEKGYVRPSFEAAVLAREKKYPTGIMAQEFGVAIPHTDCEHVVRNAVVTVTLRRPVSFAAMGGEEGETVPVECLFLILLAETGAQVKLLMHFMKIIQNRDDLRQVRNSHDASEVEALLRNYLTDGGEAPKKMQELEKHIFELSKLHGISSREDEAARYMLDAFRAVDAGASMDVLGNVTCHVSCGDPGAKKLLIFAHTDELGFIVRKVEEDGFLRISRVGGVTVNVLPGASVDVLAKGGVVRGVIGVKSHHVMTADDKRYVPEVDDLYIDIGASSRAEAEKRGVHTGCFVTFAAAEPVKLGGDLICGKAMDDRSCCAVLIEAAKGIQKLAQSKKLRWDVYLVACVQEEFNVRGIMPAVNSIRPDASIGMDICIAADTPELKGYSEIRLGGGPAITYLNFHGRGTLAGVLPDEKLLERLEGVFEDEKIRFQREVSLGIITENAFISFQNEGVAVANISVPCRYTHSQIETVDERDLEDMVRALVAFSGSLGAQERFGKNS
ncbi:MAG: PTS sugar transporter subunit IIA [Oscillospiraceae bacterium]|nr:PTS sugar transporter subunit IIA [Oscillospiraceae bacterium]